MAVVVKLCSVKPQVFSELVFGFIGLVHFNHVIHMFLFLCEIHVLMV